MRNYNSVPEGHQCPRRFQEVGKMFQKSQNAAVIYFQRRQRNKKNVKTSLQKLLVLKGLKKIESEDKTKYDTFYSNSKTEIIINESDIGDVFQSICTTIISSIQKSLGKDSGWITD